MSSMKRMSLWAAPLVAAGLALVPACKKEKAPEGDNMGKPAGEMGGDMAKPDDKMGGEMGGGDMAKPEDKMGGEAGGDMAKPDDKMGEGK
jgi:hypothetical protein